MIPFLPFDFVKGDLLNMNLVSYLEYSCLSQKHLHIVVACLFMLLYVAQLFYLGFSSLYFLSLFLFSPSAVILQYFAKLIITLYFYHTMFKEKCVCDQRVNQPPYFFVLPCVLINYILIVVYLLS